MKIKGHSTIELINVKTGEVERYEDDNMKTNALQLYLNNLGLFSISALYSDAVRANLIPALLGGVLVFDTNITENAANVICPSGVKMVGNGSYNVVSNDDVTELGSFNSSESGWTNDGKYKLVWDFTTTQANGDINCVCLTSANHGYIGEGNATSGKRKSTGNTWDYTLGGTPQYVGVDRGSYERYRIVHGSWAESTITMVDEYNLIPTAGHSEEHMSSTGKILLKTYKVPLTEPDLRMNVPAYAEGSGNQYIPVTETEITLPLAFKNALNSGAPSWFRKVGKYYYMIAHYTVADYGGGAVGTFGANDTWQICRINPDNTVSSFTVANPAGEAFDFWIFSLVFSADTIYMMKENSVAPFTHYFESLTTNADITEIANSDVSCGIIDFMYPDEGIAQSGVSKIDLGEREVYPNNGVARSYQPGFEILDDNKLVNSVFEASFGEALYLYKTTNYLATIDNLAEEITKTAEKTMKITYILRFIDEEE